MVSAGNWTNAPLVSSSPKSRNRPESFCCVQRGDSHASLFNFGTGQTPVSWAAGSGHNAIVKLLVERDDVQADLTDGRERTLLSWTFLLLDVQADSRHKYGRKPLLWAAGNGHEAAIKQLAQHGIDVDSKGATVGRRCSCRQERARS